MNLIIRFFRSIILLYFLGLQGNFMSILGTTATGAVGFGSGLVLGTVANFGGGALGGALCCGCAPMFQIAGTIAGGYFLMGSLDDSVYSTGVKAGVFVSTMIFSQLFSTPMAVWNRQTSDHDENKRAFYGILMGTGIGAIALPTIGPQGALVLGGVAAAFGPNVFIENNNNHLTRV